MFTVAFIIWIVCGAVTSSIAERKGRSGCGWLLIGLSFGPLGMVLALVISPDETTRREKAVASGKMKRCPQCAEPVQHAAVKCRYCGATVPRAAPTDQRKKAGMMATPSRGLSILFWGFALLILFFIVFG